MSQNSLDLFTKFIDEDPKAPHYVEIAEQLFTAFQSAETRIPLAQFMSSLHHLKDRSKVLVLSELLDTYVPSYSVISSGERDSEWGFLLSLTEAQRDKDRLFFKSVWDACINRKIPLNAPIMDIILNSIVKHSGLFNDRQLAYQIEVFQDEYGYIPLEQLEVYQDRSTKAFPVQFVSYVLQVCFVAFGKKATAGLLELLCSRAAGDAEFDLEQLWVDYSDLIERWVSLPIGKMIQEITSWAKDKGGELPPIDTLPSHMIYPLAHLPEEDEADDDDD